MHIRYCESCGVKLPDTHASGTTGPDYCTLCTNTIDKLPDVPVVSQKTVSRKSSATRLPAVVTPISAPRNTPPAGEKLPTNMCFYFCEACGKRLTDVDVSTGRALNKQVRGVYCASCADGVMTMTFDAITQKELSKSETQRRQGKNTPAQGSRQTAPKQSHPDPVALETPAHRTRARTKDSKTPILAVSVGCILVAAVLIAFANSNNTNQPVSAMREAKKPAPENTPSTPQARINTQPAESPMAGKTPVLTNSAVGNSEKAMPPVVTDVRAETAKSHFEQAQRNFAAEPNTMDAYREKLYFIAKNFSDTPSGMEAEKVLAALSSPAQTPTTPPAAPQSPPPSPENPPPAPAAKAPIVVDTERAAYAIWLKSFHQLWAHRNWSAAKASLAKALKNPALESKSASLKAVEECIAMAELAEKATFKGAMALQDGRAFTLESTKKKDRYELGRKSKVIKVDETVIIIEQTLAAGKIEFSLPITDLTPETKFSLARIGLPTDGKGKLALALHQFADWIKMEKSAGDTMLSELLEQARAAQAPSEQLGQLDHWLAMVDRERAAAKALASAEQVISSAKYKESKEALLSFTTDYADTAFYADNLGRISDLKKKVEALNVQPGLLASYYSGTVDDHRKQFHLSKTVKDLQQDYGRNSPAPGVPIDMYDMEMNGFLRINEPGNYTFVLSGDDHLELWLNGKSISTAKWDRQGTAKVALTAGDHTIKLLHSNNVSNASFKLRWIRPGKSNEESIPSSVLFHTPQ